MDNASSLLQGCSETLRHVNLGEFLDLERLCGFQLPRLKSLAGFGRDRGCRDGYFVDFPNLSSDAYQLDSIFCV